MVPVPFTGVLSEMFLSAYELYSINREVASVCDNFIRSRVDRVPKSVSARLLIEEDSPYIGSHAA